jgi:hypothetical protein
MRFLTATMVVGLMVAVGASSALASDPAESELERLIPGVALEEDELGAFYGTGSVSTNSGAEISRSITTSDMRIRNRIDRARGPAIDFPETMSARNAARKAFGGWLPRVSSSVDGEDIFFLSRTISF